jgi:hypothetical protein
MTNGFPIIINGNNYPESSFKEYAVFDTLPRVINDVGIVANTTQANVVASTAQANAAGASAAQSLVSANNAATSAASAIAASASADYPFATTTGTASAYLVDFTPNRVVGVGFSMRCMFHLDCNAQPTMKVDNNAAFEIVDDDTFVNGSHRPLDAGDITTGMNLVLTFKSAINKFVVTGGLAMQKLVRDLNMNGFTLVNAGDFIEGFNAIPQNIGIITSGTVALAAVTGNKKFLTNGGAFTLAAPTTDTNIELIVTNNSSAGAIALNGFTHRLGDFSTANNAVFLCNIITNGSRKIINIAELEVI